MVWNNVLFSNVKLPSLLCSGVKAAERASVVASCVAVLQKGGTSQSKLAPSAGMSVSALLRAPDARFVTCTEVSQPKSLRRDEPIETPPA